jgi:hypothetical protein
MIQTAASGSASILDVFLQVVLSRLTDESGKVVNSNFQGSLQAPVWGCEVGKDAKYAPIDPRE